MSFNSKLLIFATLVIGGFVGCEEQPGDAPSDERIEVKQNAKGEKVGGGLLNDNPPLTGG
jgi:hypothetical protein